MAFGQAYYERIWGTVHRHDYCADLAGRLVAEHGVCRILDIGTGCGELVRCLRSLGCDAWGVEISHYAIQHSCAPDYVRRGTITDLPFASNRFDVVHSQGVWEYIAEFDIKRAWAECRRVGATQVHNFDSSDETWFDEHQVVTWKPRQWWKDQFYPRVFVACPTHVCKRYASGRWLGCVAALTYPNYEVMVCDNSPNGEMAKELGQWVPAIECREGGDSADRRINLSMEALRKEFLAGPYAYWMNIEADNIPPPDVIERMMAYDADWVSHCYPSRFGNGSDYQQGIGCSLLSRRLIETFNFADADGNMSPDGWLWNRVRPTGTQFKTVELWGHFEVEHLRDWFNESLVGA